MTDPQEKPAPCEKCRQLARENLGLLLMLQEAHGDVSCDALRATAESKAEIHLNEAHHAETRGDSGSPCTITYYDIVCAKCGGPYSIGGFEKCGPGVCGNLTPHEDPQP
jgi:hypothetical protein